MSALIKIISARTFATTGPTGDRLYCIDITGKAIDPDKDLPPGCALGICTGGYKTRALAVRLGADWKELLTRSDYGSPAWMKSAEALKAVTESQRQQHAKTTL